MFLAELDEPGSHKVYIILLPRARSTIRSEPWWPSTKWLT